MNRFLSLKALLIFVLPALLISVHLPALLHAEGWTAAIHGGSMDKNKGFQDKAFDQGFFIGGKILRPFKNLSRLSIGAETNYRLMDGDEAVNDRYGVYDSSNSYKLADASALMRYALLHFRGTTLFAQMNGGIFWEKITHKISPFSTILESGSSENTGLFYSAGGGIIFFDHFELYGLYNQFEDNELVTLSIGWIFN